MKNVAIAFAAVATLAGCGGGGQLPTPLAPAASHSAISLDSAKTRKSWIAPDSKKTAQLLYVGESANGTVNIYEWPSLRPVGVLIGFSEPFGLCADKKGDVYITDYQAETISKYAHGSVTPVETLTVSSGFPASCSVNQTTGDLAVSVVDDGSAGVVLVYARGRGTPTPYTVSSLSQAYYPAYDNAGNLFVNGIAGSGTGLAELPRGRSQFEAITMNQTIGQAAGLEWDGKYLAYGDQASDVIYQFSVSGTNATVAGSTSLSNITTITQFCVTGGSESSQGNEVVVGNAAPGADAGVFSYPSGGEPTSGVTSDYPIGVVISR